MKLWRNYGLKKAVLSVVYTIGLIFFAINLLWWIGVPVGVGEWVAFTVTMAGLLALWVIGLIFIVSREGVGK